MKIEIKNVSKSFNKVLVLNDINVTFSSGKIYGLIGRNGSGKSVFFKILCGLYQSTSGSVIYDNVNMTKKQILYA